MLARTRRHNARLQVQVLYRRQPRSHAPRRTRGSPSDAEPMRGPDAPAAAGDSPHAGRARPPASAGARAQRPRHARRRPKPSRSVTAALDVRPSLRGSRRRSAPVGLREGVGKTDRTTQAPMPRHALSTGRPRWRTRRNEGRIRTVRLLA
jgi:hypothetical protein